MYALMVVFLVLVIIRPQEYPGLAQLQGLPMLPMVLAAAALLWLFSSHKSLRAPQYLLLLAFMLALMMSRVANGWVGGAVMVAERFGAVLLAFVLLANAANTRERIVTTMAAFTLCAFVLALHGIDQVRTGVGWTGAPLSQGTRIQYLGIFSDPNDLGLLFAMCLPMAVYLGTRGGAAGLRRLFWWAIAGVLLYGIYLTNSRGTLLAVVALVGVYIWMRRGIFAAGTMAGGALALAMLLPSRLQELEVTESSAMGRVEAWYHGIQMFLSRPVFGIGAGGYTDEYGLTAHNSFVLVLAESGFVGFTIWIAFLGYCVLMLLAAVGWRRDAWDDQAEGDGQADEAVLADRAADRAVAQTLLLALSGFLASGFFLSRSYVVILYLLAALVTAHYVGMRERDPGLPEFRIGHDLVRWPLWSLAGIAALYVVVRILLALT